ncbi:MAG TPA: peptidoglycan-binding domain-containing protein, partial [Acetobacteraceae bacterium]|nr:peptidoglycan-binding domain-containing protein [Acetobacteraceae bacterium]
CIMRLNGTAMHQKLVGPRSPRRGRSAMAAAVGTAHDAASREVFRVIALNRLTVPQGNRSRWTMERAARMRALHIEGTRSVVDPCAGDIPTVRAFPDQKGGGDMTRISYAAVAAAIALVLAGCAQTPTNPGVAVAPGQGKTYEAFRADQAYCQQSAQAQVAGQSEQANRSTLIGAGGGALGGAALGAAGGAIGGNAGAGTAIGALAGLALGTAGGAMTSEQQRATTQRQFDTAYAQCMYARGNDVPGFPPHVQAATTLSPNDPALVRSVQSELIRLRYLSPPADGVAGPQTISAITRFQQVSGMQPSGLATPALLARLQATPAS